MTIALPPCPDCHQPVDDIRQIDELAMKISGYRSLEVVDPRRTVMLEPCGCKVADFTLVSEGGHDYLSDLHMASGRGWRYFIEVAADDSVPYTIPLDKGLRRMLESGHDKRDT